MSIEIPDYYLNWISSLDLDEPVNYEKKDWYLYSLEELSNDTTIDSYTTPTYMQLQSFLKTQREVTGEAPLSNDDVAQCITIGENNGDPLFFKKNDNSLWCYYVDGGDIEKICDSLKTFVKESRID